jgi:hypothetical protein
VAQQVSRRLIDHLVSFIVGAEVLLEYWAIREGMDGDEREPARS